MNRLNSPARPPCATRTPHRALISTIALAVVLAVAPEVNMAGFIEDVRKEFGSNMAFVIANSGFSGDKQKEKTRIEVRQAQDAMADAGKHPEFKGNVAVVDTRPMWRDETVSPSNFGYHWNHNGYTHYEMGAGMGEAMLKLLRKP